MKLFKCPPTDLRGNHPGTDDRMEVTYSVSYIYNGGISVKGIWYDGYEVPAPLLDPGYVIVSIGVGLQLNAKPPYATGILKPESELKPGQSYLGIDGVWKKIKTKVNE